MCRTFVLGALTEGGVDDLEGGVKCLGVGDEAHVQHTAPGRHHLRDGAAEVVQPGGQVRPLREHVDEVAVTVVGSLQGELYEHQVDLEGTGHKS